MIRIDKRSLKKVEKLLLSDIKISYRILYRFNGFMQLTMTHENSAVWHSGLCT